MARRSLAMIGGVLILAFSLGGCASGKERKPWEQRKWYESNMDNEDRDFFLGSFLKPG